ncbi:unnamed protein product [Ilex paraguariensis]|uniref:Uncharacterized protein n=1 Tax=Ilex paraguariensis TaxID=185542 RepID=A0ABC8RC05_9AQUA
MALLASCWMIIESFLIPDGFVKWFYLSFYILPLFLFLCQIYLWLKTLQRWLLLIVSLDFIPFRIISFVGSCIFRFLRSWIIFIKSFITKIASTEVLDEVVEYEEPQMISQDQILAFRHVVEVYELQTRGFEKGIDYKVGSVLHVDQAMEETEVHSCDDQSSMEYISSGLSSGTPTSDADMTRSSSSISGYISSTEEVEMNVYFPSVCSSNSPVMEPESNDENNGEEMDDFYNKYTERMKWFDVLNHDRTCGISAILSKQLTSPSSFGSIEAVHLSIPHIPWKKMAKKRLLKSLESDFEMVYVAQSCLSWEALHHQYTKVEALASSRSTNGVFYNNVAGRFQKFQILLERFMEDERSEGKRYWNYVQRRFSVKSLLQVPEVSGYMEEEKEGMNGEAMRVTEVLNAIENCVKAFWLYIKTDKRKPWWKIKSFLWTYPPVEDPSDLKLLADLTKTLQQKELRLKDLRGKKRCWVKRLTNPLGESQKKEILYAMIDMKLISMVLKMSLISTSQLKWCQEKLKNIEFKEGKVMRESHPLKVTAPPPFVHPANSFRPSPSLLAAVGGQNEMKLPFKMHNENVDI